jgi:hypothetical protein
VEYKRGPQAYRQPVRWRLLLLLALAACGGANGQASWDAPIPASERRATIEVVVDLDPVSDCDERFDLGLYQERGVEMITWADDARGCAARRATVRYVPGRIGRDAVLERMKKLATKVTVQRG